MQPDIPLSVVTSSGLGRCDGGNKEKKKSNFFFGYDQGTDLKKRERGRIASRFTFHALPVALG